MLEPRDPVRADAVILVGCAGAHQVEMLLDRLAQRRAVGRRRRWRLRVLLIDDGESGFSMRGVEPGAQARWPMLQLESVALPQQAARAFFSRWPLHWGADPGFAQAVHLLVCGQGAMATALCVQALRVGLYGAPRLRLTQLGRDPERLRSAFLAAYPQAREIADLDFGAVGDAGSNAGLAEGRVPVTAVICTGDRPEQTLALAVAVRDQLASGLNPCSPPVFVDLRDTRASGDLDAWDGQLIPVDLEALALEPSALLDGEGDELARVIHEHYRDTTEAQGRDPSAEPSGAPWDTLAPAYRDANRHQADHVWAKLAVTDCLAVAEERVESFAFAPLEVERLAVIEHARWAADRWLAGWSYAPTRDNGLKHHPQLIPYEALSAPMKDLDRFAVRLVPTLLARSGLGVLRMLLVGLAPAASDLPPTAALDRQIRRLLTRLTARYPDRALVVCASLVDPLQRRLVEVAVDAYGAAFFWLSVRPLGEQLARLDQATRRQMLTLVSRAMRRIPLQTPNAEEHWLEQRADILVDFGSQTAATHPSPTGHRKRVWLGPRGGPDWGFEY